MKKLIPFLSLLLLLSGCATCLVGQIPPQNVYAGANCTAPVPDYRSFFTVTAGCTGYTLTQTPAPGFLLTATNKSVTVIVRAVGTNGKQSAPASIPVNMIDTITPRLTPTGILAEVTRQQIINAYDAGDKLFGFLDDNLMAQKWIDSIPGLREHLTSGDIHKRALVNISYENPDGTRTHSWNFVDSIKTYIKMR
jgi:hypothetical protein